VTTAYEQYAGLLQKKDESMRTYENSQRFDDGTALAPAAGNIAQCLVGLTLIVSACGGGPDGRGQPTVTAASPPAGATGIVYPSYTFTVASGGAPPFT